jgi:hypothetical protein
MRYRIADEAVQDFMEHDAATPEAALAWMSAGYATDIPDDAGDWQPAPEGYRFTVNVWTLNESDECDECVCNADIIADGRGGVAKVVTR